MFVVLWKPAAGAQADWVCARPHRVIVEYVSPRSAWSVVLIEAEGATLPGWRCRPRGSGAMNASSAAEGMQFARRIFEIGPYSAARGLRAVQTPTARACHQSRQ